jgi:hypothetical protein
MLWDIFWETVILISSSNRVGDKKEDEAEVVVPMEDVVEVPIEDVVKV